MAIRFCDTCEKCLRRVTTTGTLHFECPVCRAVYPGRPEDAHIDGYVGGGGETAAMFAKPIANAARDPTTQQIKRDCRSCGLDVMGLVRVGDSETIVFVCDCGATERQDSAE